MSKKDIEYLLDILKQSDSFKINRMFNSKVHPQWGFENRVNFDQHLIYTSEGDGYYIIGEQEVILKKGQFLFLSSGVQHTAGYRNDDRPVILPLRFSLFKNNAACDDIVKQPFYLQRSLKNRFFAETIMIKMFKLYTNPNYYLQYDQQVSSIIKLLLLLFTEEDEYNNSSDKRIQKVLEQIHSAPWKKQNLNELAESCNLSSKQFSRLFKKEVNTSPMDYIRFHRCQYASEELSSSNITIQQLSRYLDYPDAFTFSKQFKKYLGYSPREWRNRH